MVTRRSTMSQAAWLPGPHRHYIGLHSYFHDLYSEVYAPISLTQFDTAFNAVYNRYLLKDFFSLAKTQPDTVLRQIVGELKKKGGGRNPSAAWHSQRATTLHKRFRAGVDPRDTKSRMLENDFALIASRELKMNPKRTTAKRRKSKSRKKSMTPLLVVGGVLAAAYFLSKS